MPEISLETRIAILEAQYEALARTEWVKDFVKPMEESLNRMETIVTSLTTKADSLFDAHAEMLRDKAEHEREQWKSRTAFGIARRWAPLIGTAIGIFTLYQIVSAAAISWLRTHGF